MSKRTVVVFSGAGLSAESGIDTFRDKDGLWENHKVEDVASHDGWKRNKDLVLKFYQDRFNSISNAKPNAAHEAFARLESKFNVIHYTQNIDDLLERAGCSNVKHIHGVFNSAKCEDHNDILNEGKCDYKSRISESVKIGDLCAKCGSQMRPDIVWFQERVNGYSPDEIRELVRETKYNDGAFIVVGTSGNVYPAAYMVGFFAQIKNKYIVGLNPQPVSGYDIRSGKAGEMVPALVDELLS